MGRHKKITTPQGEEGAQSGFDAERANSAAWRRLDELELRVTQLEKPIPTPESLPKEKVPEPKVDNQSSFPVPVDYLETVNTILNSKFGVKVEGLSDRPQFALTIIVPKNYSPLSENEWNISKGDLRTKIINYADGINAVREWIQKVYDSFNPEVKARIKSEI